MTRGEQLEGEARRARRRPRAVSIAGAAIAGVDLVADVDSQLEGEARGDLGAGGAR